MRGRRSNRHLRALPGLLAILLLGAGPLRAFQPDPRYPLPYPPLLAVRASDVETLETLGGYPHLERLLASEGGDFWSSLPLLQAFEPERFFRTLRKHGARELTYIALPPATSPGFLFRARLDTPANPAALLAEAGLREGSGIVARMEGPVLVVAADAEVLRRWGELPEGPVGGLDWRPSLLAVLGDAPEEGLEIWMDAPWLAGVLAYETGFDLRANLLASGTPIPPALIMRVRPEGESLRLRAEIPLPMGEVSSTATPPPPRMPLAGAFPPDADAVLRIDRWAFCGQGARDLTGGRTYYDTVLDLLRIAGSGTAETSRAGLEALRQLTGLHPRALTRLLGNALAAGVWRDAAGEARWGILAVVSDADRLRPRLLRAVSWAVFLGGAEKARVGVGALEAPEALWGRTITLGDSASLAGLLGEDLLVVADSAETARSLWNATRALSPRAPEEDWVRLRLRPGRDLAAAANRLGPEYGLVLGMLQPEEIRLGRDAETLFLEARGPTAPTLLLAQLWLLPGRTAALAGRPPAEALAADAENRLRLFLEAQQIYRGLRLAAVNGRPGPYAPTLDALVTDRAEDGTPLARMYNRIYDVAIRDPLGYEVDFATVLRALAGGSAIGGYRFQSVAPDPASGGEGEGGESDGEWRWGLLALPVEAGRAPALCILDDGRLFERTPGAGEEVAVPLLPKDPAAAGWSRRD